jgi:hypothetical protein
LLSNGEEKGAQSSNAARLRADDRDLAGMSRQQALQGRQKGPVAGHPKPDLALKNTKTTRPRTDDEKMRTAQGRFDHMST